MNISTKVATMNILTEGNYGEYIKNMQNLLNNNLSSSSGARVKLGYKKVN